MRSLFVSFCLLLTASIAFGQSDRGAVTGAISDATGAVIPRASVVATNTETAAKYETISTDTGNYTLSQLPPGVYQLSDRKSTRLNSSHGYISYAVFCLKKKKKL